MPARPGAPGAQPSNLDSLAKYLKTLHAATAGMAPDQRTMMINHLRDLHAKMPPQAPQPPQGQRMAAPAPMPVQRAPVNPGADRRFDSFARNMAPSNGINGTTGPEQHGAMPSYTPSPGPAANGNWHPQMSPGMSPPGDYPLKRPATQAGNTY